MKIVNNNIDLDEIKNLKIIVSLEIKICKISSKCFIEIMLHIKIFNKICNFCITNTKQSIVF